MIGPVGSRVLLHELDQRTCEINGIGGRAALVCDDRELVALTHEAEHRGDKVLPGRTVEPGGADDEVVRVGCRQFRLARGLRAPVGTHRGGGGGLGDGLGGGTGEDVVGGDVYDPHRPRRARRRAPQVLRAHRVDRVGTLLLVLGLVHRCVRSAVDDPVGLVLAHEPLHRLA